MPFCSAKLKDLSFAEIADGTGLAEAFVTAALLGQQALPADAARTVGAKLDLDEDSILLLQMIPLRGCIDDRIQLTQRCIVSMKCCRCTVQP